MDREVGKQIPVLSCLFHCRVLFCGAVSCSVMSFCPAQSRSSFWSSTFPLRSVPYPPLSSQQCFYGDEGTLTIKAHVWHLHLIPCFHLLLSLSCICHHDYSLLILNNRLWDDYLKRANNWSWRKLLCLSIDVSNAWIFILLLAIVFNCTPTITIKSIHLFISIHSFCLTHMI